MFFFPFFYLTYVKDTFLSLNPPLVCNTNSLNRPIDNHETMASKTEKIATRRRSLPYVTQQNLLQCLRWFVRLSNNWTMTWACRADKGHEKSHVCVCVRSVTICIVVRCVVSVLKILIRAISTSKLDLFLTKFRQVHSFNFFIISKMRYSRFWSWTNLIFSVYGRFLYKKKMFDNIIV